MKVIIVALAVAGFATFYLFSSNNNSEQNIDDWAKQSVQLFKDTAGAFSSLKQDQSGDNGANPDALDKELESLLPSDELNLRYEPDFDDATFIASGEPGAILPSALLPNLFVAPEAKSGTSLKGQIFRDDNDKIIGAEVQLAIPTDM